MKDFLIQSSLAESDFLKITSIYGPVMFIELYGGILSVCQWKLSIPLRHLTKRLCWLSWRHEFLWFFYCHSRMSEKSKMNKWVLYWREYSFVATSLSQEWLLSFKHCLYENFAICTYQSPIMHQSLVLTPKVSCCAAKEVIFPWCLLSRLWKLKTAGESLKALLDIFKLSQRKEWNVRQRPIFLSSWLCISWGMFFGFNPVIQYIFSPP